MICLKCKKKTGVVKSVCDSFQVHHDMPLLCVLLIGLDEDIFKLVSDGGFFGKFQFTSSGRLMVPYAKLVCLTT